MKSIPYTTPKKYSNISNKTITSFFSDSSYIGMVIGTFLKTLLIVIGILIISLKITK